MITVIIFTRKSKINRIDEFILMFDEHFVVEFYDLTNQCSDYIQLI